VVVGVVAAGAIIAGLIFWIRHKKKQEEDDSYKKTQVSSFMNGGRELKPPPTAYSQMSDSRLDPEAGGRRNSSGSIADDQDYSRRILRVRLADTVIKWRWNTNTISQVANPDR
jgi:cell wall integrity and stress response component